MSRLALVSAGLVALAVMSVSASAEPVVKRLRGTVESAGSGTVTLKTGNGTDVSIALTPDTKYAFVTKSSLDAVKDGVFIGTATKGDNPPIALEVVVFPDAMRGTGEGHYAWDEIADTTAGGKPVLSAMTNGTIKTVARPLVRSAMTNGTIKSGASEGGAKKLTVTYDNGKSIDITVPPSAPIVTVSPADMSALKPGAKVFAVTALDAGAYQGKRLLIGKDGVTPPM